MCRHVIPLSSRIACRPSDHSVFRWRAQGVLILTAALGLGGCGWFHRSPPTDAAVADAPRDGKDSKAGKGGGKGGGMGGGRGGPPASVVVAPVRSGSFQVWADSLGTVTPLANVTIHSRVDGQLLRVNFREAQHVEKGALLAEIDPRPFQATLDQGLAAQLRDQALLDNAQIDLKRYKDLAEHDAIPRQQLDTQTSLVAQYVAAVRTDQAVVDSARLQLSFCRIEAPVSGQVGLRQIDPGNMVHAADTTGLVTVAQMDPISVLFSLPQDQLPAVQAKLRQHGAIKVQAYDRGGKTVLAEGTLASLDNQIDATTGTIKLRGKFANGNAGLYPNQFVNLRVLMNVLKDVTIAPSAGIQRGPQGTFMYVLKDDRTVSLTPVVLGPSDKSGVVVQQGLNAGEQVVIDGADKLRDGVSVILADRSSQAGAGPGRGGHRDSARDGKPQEPR